MVEREREGDQRLHTNLVESRKISCISRVLKMILGDTSRAHGLLHDIVGYSTVLTLCILSIACPNV